MGIDCGAPYKEVPRSGTRISKVSRLTAEKKTLGYPKDRVKNQLRRYSPDRKKGDYFLLIPAAASSAAPIAARLVAIPTGDFFVTAPAAGQV